MNLTFIETKGFTKSLEEFFVDAEGHFRFQNALLADPQRGDVGDVIFRVSASCCVLCPFAVVCVHDCFCLPALRRNPPRRPAWLQCLRHGPLSL
jgi:hypothetical protein